MSKVIYWDQRDMTGEQGLDTLISMVSSGAVNLCIVNSIAGIVPTKELEGEMQDQNMALN